MAGMNDFWLSLLGYVEREGVRDARAELALPSDGELWERARQWCARYNVENVFPVERVDAFVNLSGFSPLRDMLDELQEAYDEGRRPWLIDMSAVLERLREGGCEAHIEHTGGNAATLYAGRRVADASGEMRRLVVAGVGWFEGAGRTRPIARTDEFSAALNVCGENEVVPYRLPGHRTSAQEVAAMIAELVDVFAERFSE